MLLSIKKVATKERGNSVKNRVPKERFFIFFFLFLLSFFLSSYPGSPVNDFSYQVISTVQYFVYYEYIPFFQCNSAVVLKVHKIVSS